MCNHYDNANTAMLLHFQTGQSLLLVHSDRLNNDVLLLAAELNAGHRANQVLTNKSTNGNYASIFVACLSRALNNEWFRRCD